MQAGLCPECSKRVPSGARRCPHCGAMLTAREEPSETQFAWVLPAAAIASLLALAIGLFVVLRIFGR
jgi:predicted amidophosphoribosyltransferase